MSEMPGQRELLNICFACLRYSRVAQAGLPLVQPANLGNVLLKGGTQCSHCRFASTQGSAGAEEARKKQDGNLERNPFYDKYKEKLQHLARYVQLIGTHNSNQNVDIYIYIYVSLEILVLRKNSCGQILM